MPDLSRQVLSHLLWIPGLIIGFTAHELGHALVAYWLGDRGTLTKERLTLNPLKHVPWLGLLVFAIFGFGWAKPVRFRAGAFQRPHWDSTMVALAGVAMNVLVAALFLGLARGLMFIGAWVANLTGNDPFVALTMFAPTEPGFNWRTSVYTLSSSVVEVNVALALFNLIPIPPLDGFQALASLWRLIRRVEVPQSQKDGTRAVIAFGLALESQDQGQLHQAAEYYRRAVTLMPKFFEAWFNMGVLYRVYSLVDLAIGMFGAALRHTADPEERARVWDQLNLAGWVSDVAPGPIAPTDIPPLPTSQPEVALGQENHVRLVQPLLNWRWSFVLAPLAYLSILVGLVFMAVGQDPASLHLKAANQAARQGDLGRAEAELLHAAVSLRSDQAQPHSRPSLIYVLETVLGAEDGGAQEAVRLNPEFGSSYKNLAFVLYHRGQYEEAIMAAKRSVTLFPNLVAGWYILGMANRDMGRNTEAAAAFQQALSVDSQEPTDWHFQAWCRQALLELDLIGRTTDSDLLRRK